MKPVSKASFFKASALLLPLVFAACSTDDSDWYERPDNFGDVLYERHLKKGSSAAFECAVYSRGDHVTIEMNMDVMAYESAVSAVYDVEVGEPTNYYVDLTLSGMFQDEASDFCEGIKGSVDGMKTSCSKSRVKGKAEMASVSDAAASLMLGSMVPKFKEQCDYFYDTYKELMAEFPGRWDYGDGNVVAEPALSCEVNVSGDTLYMNADFSTRSVAMVVYRYVYNGISSGSFITMETYTGVDQDALAKVCAAYRKEDLLTGVECVGPMISYMAPETQDGVTLTIEDMAVYMKKQICAGFLDGSYSLEDMWYND